MRYFPDSYSDWIVLDRNRDAAWRYLLLVVGTLALLFAEFRTLRPASSN